MKVIQLFSEVNKLRSEWEVRVEILLSLLLQIILLIFGYQRRHRRGIWIKILVWSTYMSADQVATVTLGNLAKIQMDSGNSSSIPENIALKSFWAPFLLLHLGGQDSITAYTLEDNELWLRHLLWLVVEVGMAFYVFFRSFDNTALAYVSIPIYVAGIIKYGERIYVLRSASNKQFKEDVLSTNPIVEKSMRIAMGIKDEDFVEIVLMEESRRSLDDESLGRKQLIKPIEEAHFLYQRFEYLFANLILPFSDRIDCSNIMRRNNSSKEAFELVAMELGFMYEVLYTKANRIRTRLGFILRVINFFPCVLALIVFSIVIDIHAYPPIDVSITFVLLVWAVSLEIYAFIIFVFSDWTRIWLVKHQLLKIDSFHRSCFTKKWSASVAQYNIMNYCLGDIQGMFIGVWKLPFISNFVGEYPYLSWKKVDDDLQQMIFEQLKNEADILKYNYSMKACRELLGHRGDHVLENWNKLDEFRSSTIDVDFDHSLLVWHIATGICYHINDKHDSPHREREISKCLSDYMLYLLVVRPSMLPNLIGEIRCRDTCKQIKDFLENVKSEAPTKKKVFEKLYDFRPKSRSILSEGCELARKLIKNSNSMPPECEWKMITEVWIEMLMYAASHCGWKEHAQQLRQGGEFLTHVCLLMAYLGLSKQYNDVFVV